MAETADVEQTDTLRYWLNQLEAAKKYHQDKWYERGQKVIDKYLDKKEIDSAAQSHTMNVLWSNVETITPALYAKTPTPKVSRRHRDKDAVGRWAGITLERSLDYTFDAYDVDYHIRSAIKDYLLPGRGQVWVSYKPTIKGKGPDQKLEWECAETKHLHWKDFLTNPARTWDEVWWVAQRAYMSEEEVAAHPKLGPKAAKSVSFAEIAETETSQTGSQPSDRVKKAEIWEIWCKTTGLVYYVSKSAPDVLSKPGVPPIDFADFFPCPRPLTTTTTPDSILPVPDYAQYQNQAEEINRLTQRINVLTKALKVVGVYDASTEALQNLLDVSTPDNTMHPVANWAVFAGNKGLEGSVSFLPLSEIIEALQQCYVSRDAAKQVMYEITGISDIVRGAANPNETATAQQIKTQWGSLRIRDRQSEVQRFVRDIIRLQAEVVAEHFQLDTLKTMANCPLATAKEKQVLQQRQQFAQQAAKMMQQNPQQAQAIAQANPQLAQMAQPLSLDELQRLKEPAWEDVYGLLKDQRLRSFRIDIETDSTIQGDDMAEKESRTEFITAITGLVQVWGPIVQANPKYAPVFGEVLLFGVRAFKTADLLEGAIEEAVDSMQQQALMPTPPPPQDPKVALEEKKQAFAEKQHADSMGLEQKKQQDATNLKAHEIDTKAQVEVAKAQAARPQIADAGSLAPLIQLIQQQIAQMAADHGNTTQATVAMLRQELQQIAQLALAPKQITVNRDKTGRIQGATATPMMQ